MTDLILESIRTTIVLCLFVYLIRTGMKRRELCRKGWGLIVVGFGLICFGSLIDITDNFESLNRFIFIGDTPVQAFFEKMVGNLCGFLVLTIGLGKWIPTIVGIEHEKHLHEKVQEEIAEHKRAEEELEEKKERLRLALRGGNLGTWDWNIQNGSVEFNEHWAEMKGYRLDELEPTLRTWEDWVHPHDLPEAYEKLNAHFEGETDFYEAEFRMKHKSGKWIWILDRGEVIERDKDGNPLRACGTHQDITGRKRAQEELQRTLADTERMNRLMSGREDRVLELKDEVNVLLAELGREAKYGRTDP